MHPCLTPNVFNDGFGPSQKVSSRRCKKHEMLANTRCVPEIHPKKFPRKQNLMAIET